MTRYKEILSTFKNAKVGVIGDMAADVYIFGSPERLSREAPVMVVNFEGEKIIPGCAANTMNNLLAFGCGVAPVSVLGDDKYGKMLRQYFEERNVSLKGIVDQPGFETITKTRVMVGDVNRTKQQVIRIDHTPPNQSTEGLDAKLLAAVDEINVNVDAWLVSDYGYLPFSEKVATKLTSLTKKQKTFDRGFEI